MIGKPRDARPGQFRLQAQMGTAPCQPQEASFRGGRVMWQPIETAPKEGAFLVLLGTYVGIALVKRWSLHDLSGVSEGAAWVGQRPYENGMTLWLGGADPSDATHWMPLPAPPVSE